MKGERERGGGDHSKVLQKGDPAGHIKLPFSDLDSSTLPPCAVRPNGPGVFVSLCEPTGRSAPHRLERGGDPLKYEIFFLLDDESQNQAQE